MVFSMSFFVVLCFQFSPFIVVWPIRCCCCHQPRSFCLHLIWWFGGRVCIVVAFLLASSDVVCRSNSPPLLLTLLRVLSSTPPAAPSLSSDCIGQVPSISSPFWLYPFILGRLPGCSLFNQCDVVFGGLCMQRVGVCNYVARVDLVGARGRADCRLVMSW